MSAQPPPFPTQVDVVVAGGGPTGLFLATELSHRGVSCVVLEPREELDWLHPRAKTTNARTMTHLRRLGLADALREAAPLTPQWSDHVAFCTSLVGRELTRFRHAFQLDAGRYGPQPECGQQVAQPVVEQVLRAGLEASDAAHLALGVRLDRSTDLGADGVETVAVDADGTEHRIRSRFLVGADGVGSTVRRGLGVRLEGGSAAKSNLGLLFRSARLAESVALDPAVQYWVVGREYAGMVGPMDLDGLWWAIVQGYDPAAPQFAGVGPQEVLRSLVGADVDVELLAEDPWTARMLLAPTYRVGNVLLAGDAAHANPPWGGHGFNTCVGDAANLAWKLAGVVHGWAGPGLLDSYEPERRPVARRTIAEAQRNGEVLADDLMDDDLDRPGAAGDAARARAAQALAVKESEFHSLGLVLGYHYAGSPIVADELADAPLEDPVRYEPSTAPGCLLPHHWIDASTSLYDVLGADFTVLLRAAPGAVTHDDTAYVETGLVDAGLGVPVTVRTVPWSPESAAWPDPWLLVRPDQHVAWRGSSLAGLVGALRRAVGRAAGAPDDLTAPCTARTTRSSS
ncbi:FAD-dependent monooxygenase [Isoptericola sp. F-RaC21]|uniref:FAD-dependent monooxygenase n=1 Tax=Isoptericola sp. F-RaC21 TaxID=3141452 RepID=UPI00315BB8AF